eukprot:2135495-Pyramimonas_sp.AAC.1
MPGSFALPLLGRGLAGKARARHVLQGLKGWLNQPKSSEKLSSVCPSSSAWCWKPRGEPDVWTWWLGGTLDSKLDEKRRRVYSARSYRAESLLLTLGSSGASGSSRELGWHRLTTHPSSGEDRVDSSRLNE